MFGPKIRGLFHLFRFELPLTAGVCGIGGITGIRHTTHHNRNLIGVSKHFFISAASLILDDYFYIESDKINAPERPLPAGLVTQQDVVLLFVVVTMLGFITGYLIGLEALLVILVWVAGFLYNWRFKKAVSIGNLMVILVF